MPQFQRRHFLQLAGSTLATVGLSQANFLRQSERYGKALAQDTPRKLALLVGVNNYPGGLRSLRGCLTDVEMQYELLVHRFGFQPEDIQIISDPMDGILRDRITAPPTRTNILTAFENHLINQAKDGDVVVFHYSGHGATVKDNNGIPGFDNKNGTLVPNDGRANLAPGSQHVNDIMGKTLFLLTYALKTDNVSLILDSCHSQGGTRGNLLYRSIVNDERRSTDDSILAPADIEIAYQEQWRERNNLSPQQLQELRQAGIAKGIAMGSARINQLAADAPFGDFHAGAFTYLLTRYLWQQVGNQSLDTVFINLARTTRDVAKSAGIDQEPIYAAQPNSNAGQEPPLFLEPPKPSAEAVVRKIDGDQVTFWLGGVSPQNIEAFTEGAIFNLIDATGNPIGEITQTGRAGLEGYGTLAANSRSIPGRGALLREQVRGIPADLSLRVGVDSSLGNQKNALATALGQVNRVTVVQVDQTQPIDYLVGRLTTASKAQATNQGISIPSPVGSIGLFTPGLTPIPDSFYRPDESVDNAVRRLRPRMKMLLAGRILKSVVNSNISDINVDVKVTSVGAGNALLTRRSRGAQATDTGLIARSLGSDIQQASIGDQIKVEVTNHEPQDLYISIIVIDSKGQLFVLHPVTWDAAEPDTLVRAGKSITVPTINSDFDFIIGGPAGHFELLILASTAQLRDALRGLKEVARGRGIPTGMPLVFGEGETRGSNESDDAPVQVLDDLLRDVSRNARSTVYTRSRQSADAKRLAVFSAVFEVVAATE